LTGALLMPTRGLLGFYINSKWYVIYNEFDSYPKGLGDNILKDIRKAHDRKAFDKWRDQVPNLRIIDTSVSPTPEDVKRYAAYTNLKKYTKSTDDWKCLLFKAKNLSGCLSAGCIMNHVTEDGQPIWQHYAYILNYDTNKIDFYKDDKLIESREFNDFNRPFPEVEEAQPPPPPTGKISSSSAKPTPDSNNATNTTNTMSFSTWKGKLFFILVSAYFKLNETKHNISMRLQNATMTTARDKFIPNQHNNQIQILTIYFR